MPSLRRRLEADGTVTAQVAHDVISSRTDRSVLKTSGTAACGRYRSKTDTMHSLRKSSAFPDDPERSLTGSVYIDSQQVRADAPNRNTQH